MTSSGGLEAIRTEIDRQIVAQNYREAYRLYDSLSQRANDGELIPDLPAILKHIQEAATKHGKELRVEIDTMTLVPIDRLDIDALRERLEAFQRTVPNDNDANYTALREVFVDRETRRRDYDEYQSVKKLVEYEWSEAQREADLNKGISASTLLNFYTRARDIASTALARNPSNMLLEQLLKDANARRENLNVEEEVMTSGGQIGDFTRVLRYLASRGEDDAVMVYDNVGTPIGRLKPKDARKEVIKQANAYVTQKTGQYRDAAKDALDRLQPRLAALELEKYLPFFELQSFVGTEEVIIRRNVTDEYENLRRTAQDAINKLTRAEESSKKAAAQAHDNPVNAWALFKQALLLYEGVYNSQSIVNDRETIQQSLLDDLKEKHQSVQNAIRLLSFETAQRTANEVLAQYKIVTTPLETRNTPQETQDLVNETITAVKVEVAKLEALLSQAIGGKEIQTRVREALVHIRDLSMSKPLEAKDKLRKLILEYGEELVASDPDYTSISARVETATNVDEGYRHLESYLEDQNIERVRDAYQQASTEIHNVKPEYRKKFEELASQLGYHLQMLEAEVELRSQGYDAAIQHYEKIKREAGGGLRKGLDEKLKNRLEVLYTERQTAVENIQRLTEVERLLSETSTPEEMLRKVWAGLLKVERFSDVSQRTRWISLFRRSLDHLQIHISFDKSQLEELLRFVGQYDKDLELSQQRALEKFKKAQAARDNEKANYLDVTRTGWESLLNMVGDVERVYVIERLDALNKLVAQKAKAALIQQILSPDKGDITFLLANIHERATEYRRRSTQTENMQNRMDYEAWALELDLWYAQITPDTKTQRNMLNAARENAQRLKTFIAAYETQYYQRGLGNQQKLSEMTAEARRMVKLAEIAPKIGDALEQVQTSVNADSDISGFVEAVNAARTALYPTDKAEQEVIENGFASFQQMFMDKLNGVRDLLRNRINQQTDPDLLSPENLVSGVKLLIIQHNDDLGVQMMKELEKAPTLLLRRFASLINGIPTGLGYIDENNKEISLEDQQSTLLHNQIETLRAEQTYLKLVANIGERFPGSLRAETENDRRLFEKNRSFSAILDEVIKQLVIFQTTAENFWNWLEAYALNDENWQIYQDEIARHWNLICEQVDDVGRGLSETCRRLDSDIDTDALREIREKHPAMMVLRREKENLLRMCNDVTKVYHLLKDHIENDRFAEANTVIHNATDANGIFKQLTVKDFLKKGKLHFTVTVHGTVRGEAIRGWDNIVAYVNEVARIWDGIERWSQPFYKDPVPGTSKEPGYPVADNVVAWLNIRDPRHAQASQSKQDLTPLEPETQQYMSRLYETNVLSEAMAYQVLALLGRADFDNARKRVQQALTGEGGLPAGTYSLTEALDILSCYPKTTQYDPQGMTTSLDEALANAGSKRGQDRIRWIYENRVRVYEEHKQDAEQMLIIIENRRKEFAIIEQDCKNKMNALITAVDNFGKRRILPGRGRKNEALQSAFDDVIKTINRMRQSFPYSQRVRYYENAEILNEAKSLLGIV